MNAALINGTRENASQTTRQPASRGRRSVRYVTLLAKLRRRQLDLAIAGQIELSGRYARRASLLSQHIVIVTDGAGVANVTGTPNATTDTNVTNVNQDQPMLECCCA